jgi:GNAT superfamily N-acetyltransferase
VRIGARPISPADASDLQHAFASTPWDRGLRFFEQLAERHEAGARRVWVGLADGRAVAFASLVPESAYPPFRERRIPEIQDLNVGPRFRRLGVASCVLDHAESDAFGRGDAVGIGFGLHAGYAAAQRLYVLRGYVPDGRGVFSRGRFPGEGESVRLDDDLVLYLVKPRPPARAARPA